MGHLSQKEYEEALEPLLRELSDAARWIQERGQRLVVLFEGRDTAGKGGSIHMFASTLNPRQCHVVALPALIASAEVGIAISTSIDLAKGVPSVLLTERSGRTSLRWSSKDRRSTSAF